MRKLLSIFIAFSVLFLTGCIIEEHENSGNSKAKKGFTLSYSVTNPVAALTRASVPIIEGEDNITSFYILFFAPTSGGTGKFIDGIDAMKAYETAIATSGVLDIEFPEDSPLKEAEEYKMLLCANIEDYIDSSFPITGINDLKILCDGKNEQEVIYTLLRISGVTPGNDPITEQQDNTNRMPIEILPMSASARKESRQENVSIELTRGVSRFDVYCNASGYELVSASVWNAYTATAIWEGAFSDFRQPRTERYYGVDAENNKIIGQLYAFENFVSSPEQKDKKTTCLIIGLRKTGTEKTEYFRTNINATGWPQQLKRNTVYKTSITAVNSQGAENERKAYEEGTLGIEVDINGWTLDESGNLQYNGDNILALPTTQVTLHGTGDSREYNIYALGGKDEKLTMTLENIPSHIEVELSDLNILSIKAGASEKIHQGGIIKLYFAGMTATILLEQFPVDKGDHIELTPYELPAFSASRGDQSEWIQVSASASWEAEIYIDSNFSFEPDRLVAKKEGEPGEKFKIYTVGSNNGREARYGFMVVKLKDQPLINCGMLLTQSDEIRLEIDYDLIEFHANGNLKEGFSDIFTVSTYTGDEPASLDWEIIHLSGPDAFTITRGINGNENQFTVKTDEKNTTGQFLEGIYRIRLTDTPDEIYKDIKVFQDTYFLEVTPTIFDPISVGGGSTPTITVTCNSTWTAELTVNGNNAGFNGDINLKTISETGNNTFTVTFPELTVNHVFPKATITVTIDDTDIKESFTVSQQPTSQSGILVWTNTLGISTLARADMDPVIESNNGTNRNNHYQYVYNWGENMRNKELFGAEGKVSMPAPYIFHQGGDFTHATIFQLVSKPTTTAEVLRIKAVMDENPGALIIMSHTDAAVNNTLTTYGKTLFGDDYKTSNITAGSVGSAKGTKRYINPELLKDMNNLHPLVEYLLNGPFSTEGRINPDQVELYGPARSTNQGLTKWPSTFIPIILADKSKTPCVFGIDPVHRLIWIGDPGIFGSNSADGNNHLNFQEDRPENIAFLNNFIAWMTNVAVGGSSFLEKFQ